MSDSTTYIAAEVPALLRPWLTAENGLQWRTESGLAVPSPEHAVETVSGSGLLAESPRQFQIRFADAGVDLRLDGGFRANINRSGKTVRLTDVADAGLDALLGPPLILALALRGIHCLHASAAISPSGLGVAFSAPSGTGKSTLARAAAASGWQRLSDDLCPLSGSGQIQPRFPQLKLGPHASMLPASVDLAHFVLLQRGANTQLQPLSTTELAKLLLAATVGAKMYSAAMRKLHFLWATATANRFGARAAWRLTIAESATDPMAAVTDALDQLLERWS